MLTPLKMLAARMRGMFSRRREDEEFSCEIREHLDMLTEENARRGMPLAEAQREAKIRLGGATQLRETHRELTGLPFLETLIQDLRFALRMLRKSPGFTAVAVLTLALGIGANTAIFSLFDSIVWHALPVPHFSELFLLNEHKKGTMTFRGVSAADLLDWQTQTRSFEQLAGYTYKSFNLTGSAPVERIDGAVVTPNFFRTLGTCTLVGRAFLPEEGQPSHSHVAILSYGFWQSHFAARPDAVGQSLELDGSTYTVVGVMPRGLDYPTADLWVPLALTSQEQTDRAQRNLEVLGRLKPANSLSRAESEFAAIETHLAETYPKSDKDVLVYFEPLRVSINGNLTYSWGIMFMGAMGIVLLIACTNVAILQFARGRARQREIGVRAALGASRQRVARQLFTEAALIALLGAGLGLLFADWGVHLMKAAMPPLISRLMSGWNEMHINGRALAFTMVVAAISAILSGLAPALQSSKLDLNQTLKEGGSATPGRSHHRLQSTLVVGEVALALVLLVGAVLFVRGVQRFTGQQKSYAPSGVLTLRVQLPQSHYARAEQRLAFYQKAVQGLHALPGVQSAAVFSTIPFSNNGGTWASFEIAGQPTQSERFPTAQLQTVSPSFFSLLHIPVLSGRDFGSQDGPTTVPVAIVSENLATQFWPREAAIGQHIRLVQQGSSGPWLTVIGVVGNVLWDWTDNLPEFAIFQPFSQSPGSESLLAVRTQVAPESLIATARREIAGIDPELPVQDPETLTQAIHDSFAGIPLLTGMMTSLGLIAFVLVCAGIYSLMSYSVAERTREIGLRMVLGATRGNVSRMFLRRGAYLLLAGLAIGLPVSFALTRLLAGLIYGVRATDPLTFCGTVVLLMLVGLAACYIPARRATRVDPMVALRYE
ncbi:MAG: ABC transporter permease [Candidatus Acidiferrales bacterium]